jgi:hypothetical protein
VSCPPGWTKIPPAIQDLKEQLLLKIAWAEAPGQVGGVLLYRFDVCTCLRHEMSAHLYAVAGEVPQALVSSLCAVAVDEQRTRTFKASLYRVPLSASVLF